jgi:putative addiction module component (TIGR02574 family)
MTRAKLQEAALSLPAEEREELAEVLWESLGSEKEPLPDWQRRLLDQRLKAFEENPEAGSPWEEVRRRVWPTQE